MDTSNISIQRVDRVGENPNDKERASFYKDKMNIPINCKELMETKIFILKSFY